MSVLDFPDVNPDTGTSLSLKTNTTTFTSDLNNAVQTGKLVGDQWAVNMPFTNRTEKEGRRIKAFLARLGGVTGRFRMTPPDLNQLGTMSGSGVVDGSGQQGATLNTKGWNAEQPELFVEGDYLEVNGELKMIVDDVSAGQDYIEYSEANYIPSPFDPEGWYGANFEGDILYNVTEENPSGSSVIGYAEQVGTDQFVLCGSRDGNKSPVSIGDRMVASIIIKPSTSHPPFLRFRFADDQGFSGDAYYDTTNNTLNKEGLITNLDGGYRLVQVPYTAVRDDAGFYSEIFMWADFVNTPTPSGAAPIGSNLYVQACFIGKSDGWPALLLAKANINIAPPLRKATNDLDPIEVANPQAIFMLANDNQASWDLQANYVHGATIDCIEDVT